MLEIAFPRTLILNPGEHTNRPPRFLFKSYTSVHASVPELPYLNAKLRSQPLKVSRSSLLNKRQEIKICCCCFAIVSPSRAQCLIRHDVERIWSTLHLINQVEPPHGPNKSSGATLKLENIYA